MPARVVAAARACLGTPFRPQGRVPGLGLDCVGLVLVAARAAGLAPVVPAYRLSGDHAALLAATLAALGCRPAAAAPGTVMVLAPGGRARHLGIVSDCGLIHAHAGLGRVVEGPIDPDWTKLGCWRLARG